MTEETVDSRYFVFLTTPGTETDTQELETNILLTVSSNLWKYVVPIMMITGLIGNSLSFLVMMGRRFRKQTFAVYFCALALADSYSLLNSLPRFWYPTVTNIHPTAHSDAICRFSTFSLYYSYQVSSWVLLCVTVERALAVAFPLKTKHTFTRRKAVITLLIVSALLFCYNCYILFYKDGYLMEMEDGTTVCGLDVFYTAKPFFKSHLWMDVLLCSIIPFAFIITSNIVIVKKVIESRKLLSLPGKHRKNVSTPSLKMLLCVSSMFIFFTLPLSIMLLYMQIYQVLDVENDGVPSILWACALILLYCNNSLNFFLYCLTGRTFRKQLVDYFTVCRVSKPTISSMLFSSYYLKSIDNAEIKQIPGAYIIPVAFSQEPASTRL